MIFFIDNLTSDRFSIYYEVFIICIATRFETHISSDYKLIEIIRASQRAQSSDNLDVVNKKSWKNKHRFSRCSIRGFAQLLVYERER